MPKTTTSSNGALSLLGNPKIVATIKDIAKLRQPIGNAASQPIDLSTKSEGAPLSIFNQAFTGTGSLTAAVSFLGKGKAVDAFGTGVPVQLGGANAGLLEVLARFGLETSQSVVNNGQGLSLSASAGASGEIRYRHYLPFASGQSQLKGVEQLVLGSRLPNLMDLSNVPAVGEIHRLDAKIDLDFGLEASAGYKFAGSKALELAGDISTPLKLDVEATLKASIGLSMFEEMSLTIGRAGQLDQDSDWIRLRLQRSHERKMSFGVTFSLDLNYDLGQGLVKLFEEALDQVPVPRLVTTASKITTLLKDGDWDTIKTQLTGKLAEAVEDYIGEKGWLDLAASDPRIKKLIDLSGKITKAYDGVDERVASLWDRLLDKASLEPGSNARTWLEDLAGLASGSFKVEDLLSGEASKWVLALETLSGRSLEQMVLSGDLGDEIKKVSGLAQQALDFVNKTPAKVLQEIEDFAEKTGIRRTVDVLRQFDSVEALKTTATTRIQSLSERIVGKAFDQIDANDLAKIQKFAGRLLPFIPDPDADGTKANQLRKKIKDNLAKVNIDYGLSVSLEIERISRSTALLDLELNPRGTKRLKHFRSQLSDALRAGAARRVLEELAEEVDLIETKDREPPAKDKAPDPSKVPFLIRESAFTSERIRSSAVSIVFSLVGLGKLFKGKSSGFTRRTEQTSIRIVDRLVTEPAKLSGDNDPKRFLRTGRYSAGFQRGSMVDDLTTETSLWLVNEDQGSGLRLDRSYNLDQPRRFLRTSFSLDSTAKDNELMAIPLLLHQLGFGAVAPPSDGTTSPSPDAEAFEQDPKQLRGQSIRFALEMQFPVEALRGFLKLAKNEDLWNQAFVNTCHRWATEGFVPAGAPDLSRRATTGQVLAGVFSDRLFLDNWHSVGGFFGSGEVQDAKQFKVEADGSLVTVPIGTQNKPEPLTGYLLWVMRQRKRGFAALQDLAGVNLTTRNDKVYKELAQAFVRAAHRSAVASLRWPNSTFALWLWISGLAFADPKLLAGARGMASLRWRNTAAGDEEWSGPALWTVEGIPDHFVPSVFPIPRG